MILFSDLTLDKPGPLLKNFQIFSSCGLKQLWNLSPLGQSSLIIKPFKTTLTKISGMAAASRFFVALYFTTPLIFATKHFRFSFGAEYECPAMAIAKVFEKRV